MNPNQDFGVPAEIWSLPPPAGIEVRSGLLERKLARRRQDHNDYVIAAITFASLIRQCLFSESSVASRICASGDWAHIIWTISTYLRVCMREYIWHSNSITPWYQGRFYCEANKAWSSGPLTCTGSFRGPGTGPNNALEMPWNLRAHIWKKLARVLPILTTILKLYVTSKTGCEADKKSLLNH